MTRLLSTQGPADPLAELSPREREVLSLMAEGRTNAGIAKRLWLTEKTVETHVRSILMKLGAAGRHRRPPAGHGRARPTFALRASTERNHPENRCWS